MSFSGAYFNFLQHCTMQDSPCMEAASWTICPNSLSHESSTPGAKSSRTIQIKCALHPQGFVALKHSHLISSESTPSHSPSSSALTTNWLDWHLYSHWSITPAVIPTTFVHFHFNDNKKHSSGGQRTVVLITFVFDSINTWRL
jgi:hypothetical protein